MDLLACFFITSQDEGKSPGSTTSQSRLQETCVLNGRWRGHGVTGGCEQPPRATADMKKCLYLCKITTQVQRRLK